MVMTPRMERFLAALLLSFCLWCLKAFLDCREVTAEQIKMDTFEGEFYPTVADIESMKQGYEDYQVEASEWFVKRSTASPRKRGKSS